jgi:crotonyl-CoA carboxylase/reductase
MADDDRSSVATPGAEPTPIGELPPIGVVPRRMQAQVVRPRRYGDPPSPSSPKWSTRPASDPRRS